MNKLWNSFREPKIFTVNQISKSLNPPPNNNLYKCLKPLLIFGQLIGLLPFKNLLWGDVDVLVFKTRKTLRTFISFLICISLAFCCLVGVVSSLLKKDVKGMADTILAINPIIFYFMGFFSYSYFLIKGDPFISLLKDWTGLKLACQVDFDRTLRRDLLAVLGVIGTSAILENLLQQLITLSILEIPTMRNGTDILWPFEAYFQRTKQPNWAFLFPYSPILSILMFLWNKFALYSWNFVDLLIISLARPLYFHFSALKNYTDFHVVTSQGTGLMGDEDQEKEWKKVTRDFETIFHLLEKVNQFLSPLIFVSYFVNIFFITIHIHMGLTPPSGLGHNRTAAVAYRTWSFFHLAARLWTITLFGARVNENAQEFLNVFRKCPRDCYTLEVQRTDKFARSRKLGLNGLNCFVLTKPFILSLAGVILTLEMVLLQTSGFSYF